MATAPLPTSTDGALVLRCDEAGLLHVTGRGFWTAAQIAAHFHALEAVLVAHRQSGMAVRVLVDLREAAVQSPEIAARIRAETDRLYAPQDRVAILVASSLARMQMRRVVDPDVHEVVLTEAAAEAWLGARN